MFTAAEVEKLVQTNSLNAQNQEVYRATYESFSKDVWFTLLDHVTVNSPTDVKYTFRDGSVI